MPYAMECIMKFLKKEDKTPSYQNGNVNIVA